MEGQNTIESSKDPQVGAPSAPPPTVLDTVEDDDFPAAGAVAEAKQVANASQAAPAPAAAAASPAQIQQTAAPTINPAGTQQPKTNTPHKREKGNLAGKLNSIDLSFRVSLSEKVFLARHLATILKSGISLLESLKIVRDQNRGKLRKILDDVIEKVENGKALNVALSDHRGDFDPLFISMIKVGEKSGSLDQSLQYLAEQLSKDSKLISKVKSASLYPVIVLISAVGVGGGVAYFILPKLTRLFSSFGAKLPLPTRMLMWLSKSIETQGLYWLATVIVAVIFFWLIFKIKIVKTIWQKIVIRIPVFGKLSKSLNLARISLTLGTLLKNNVAIVEALNITAEAITFLPYKNAIKTISSEVSQGKSINDGIMKADPRAKLFEPTTKAMIHVGERTGSLYNSLLYISEFYEEEVDDLTKNMATILEPVLLIVIAVIVGFVAISIISPMYQILNYINK